MLSLSGNAYIAIGHRGNLGSIWQTVVEERRLSGSTKLERADLKRFFAGATTTTNLADNTDATGLADTLKTTIDTYLNSSTGMLIAQESRLDDALDDIAEDRLAVVARMESLEERYTKQFTAMDTLVGQLQGTSDFLTNQMDAIKAAANR